MIIRVRCDFSYSLNYSFQILEVYEDLDYIRSAKEKFFAYNAQNEFKTFTQSIIRKTDNGYISEILLDYDQYVKEKKVGKLHYSVTMNRFLDSHVFIEFINKVDIQMKRNKSIERIVETDQRDIKS